MQGSVCSLDDARWLKLCQCLSKEGALTRDSSGSIGATQIGSPEVRVTEMRGQSSSLGRFDSRIDAASLATLADLGLSEVQIGGIAGVGAVGSRRQRRTPRSGP